MRRIDDVQRPEELTARPGDLVAVQGIGGLGHLAVQFAHHMGFRVAAIARGEEKRRSPATWEPTIISTASPSDPAAALQALGGASVILATAASGKAMSPLIRGLRARGRLIVVGVGLDPIEVTPFQLVFGTRTIEGSLTGSPLDSEATLAFSALEGSPPKIETLPLEAAAEAYGKMIRNEARSGWFWLRASEKRRTGGRGPSEPTAGRRIGNRCRSPGRHSNVSRRLEEPRT